MSDLTEDGEEVEVPAPEGEAPSITIDRGQPVIVIATFGDAIVREPEQVFFSYVRPGSERPYTDDGYGQARSEIKKIARGVYRYTFSTVDFTAGEGHWVFTAEWDEPLPEGHDKAKIRGTYVVRDYDAPRGLV